MRNSKRSAARTAEPDSQAWQDWLAGPPPPKKGVHWLLTVAIVLATLAVLEVGAVVVMIGGMWLACDPGEGGC